MLTQDLCQLLETRSTCERREIIIRSAKMICKELQDQTQGKSHYFGLGKTHAHVGQIEKFKTLLDKVSKDIRSAKMY